MSNFAVINVIDLDNVIGGQGPAQPQQPAQPPRNITTGDVVNTTGKATQAVLSGGTSLLGNLGQAYRQFNDPRVGTNFMDRAAYGFTGLFGIDPLKP